MGFEMLLNVCTVQDVMSECGEFQVCGAVTKNAPKQVQFVLLEQTYSRMASDDHRRWLGEHEQLSGSDGSGMLVFAGIAFLLHDTMLAQFIL